MKNWIDRYLYQIEKNLPQKNRADLIAEIKSNLYDELDEKYKGHQPTEKEILQVLQDNGSPSILASAYRGTQQALIGGTLYPIYLLVLKIVLPASIIGIFVATGIAIGFGSQSFWAGLGNLFSSMFQVAITAVGMVTVIFVLIERFADPDELKQEIKNKPWNPKELPAVPTKQNRLKRSDSIATIVFLTLFIIGFNYFSDSITWLYSANETRIVMPVFNPEILKQYLPWLNAFWLASIVFHIVLLIKNRWNTGFRLIKIGFDWTGLGLFLWIVSNPTLFTLQDGGLYDLFASIGKIGLAALIGLTLFETGRTIYHMLKA
ncbi:hypothetical protein SANA_26860 [Gottschalkiaceae bacterium SANA]|nr:hypothetical protein SANA_26860 [Gottschalkiaceae bacterium SANA]